MFFGQWSFKKLSFWDLLTFSISNLHYFMRNQGVQNSKTNIRKFLASLRQQSIHSVPNLSSKNRLYGIERFSSIFCVKNDRSCKKVWWPLEQIAVKMHNANTRHSGWIAPHFFWKIVAKMFAVTAKLKQLWYSSYATAAMLLQIC